MSRRVTRSEAKKQAILSASISQPSPAAPSVPQVSPSTIQASSRKRKTTSDPQPPANQAAASSTDARTAKRQRRGSQASPPTVTLQPRSKRAVARQETMSSTTPHEKTSGGASTSQPSSSSKKRSSKKKVQDTEAQTPSTGRHSSRRTSGRRTKQPSGDDEDVALVAPKTVPPAPVEDEDVDDEDDLGAEDEQEDEEDEEERLAREEAALDDLDEDDAMGDDPFTSGFLGRGSSSMSNTLRALSGMMSGMSSRLKSLLENLKQHQDPSLQFVALQELSELLLVSAEDNLAGHFSPDAFLKELIRLMQPGDFGEENPEMMLLACRCIGNMMEVVPSTTASVVYSGAVPVIVSKLLEIQYMDLAEQALITLEKISVEFPASIVREGGLTACLTYLDFFATGVQRTAVTTAANCCRNIPDDSFSTVKEVMPILLNVLRGNDQRVVENGCLCVSRIVESFKYQPDKLEELVSTDLLRGILSLLLPGSTNLVGSHIHTQFIRVLAITARSSPKLTGELFKMNVVETLYQILTGVSPPSDTEDVAQKIDSVVVMQALIHRPRDQIVETLNVIYELLPSLESKEDDFPTEIAPVSSRPGHQPSVAALDQARQKRLEVLAGCKPALRRFAIVLFPTLVDAYSSTVNLSVRQKVLLAQVKMLQFLDTDILQEALQPVPFSSCIASILSQQDHPLLVTAALYAAMILLRRLGDVYRYQFHREGVIAEIQSIVDKAKLPKNVPASTAPAAPEETAAADDEPEDEGDEDDDDDHDGSDSDSSSDEEVPSQSVPPSKSSMHGLVPTFAKRFIDLCHAEDYRPTKEKAGNILEQLRNLVADIDSSYDSGRVSEGAALFGKLTKHFEGDALDSVTSYELLTSQFVSTLLDIFQNPDGTPNQTARAAFNLAFMRHTEQQNRTKTATSSPGTPFSSLVQKLQDLLSRAEHFEVFTVHSHGMDSNRSSAASMLAKQIRIRLTAIDDSGIPARYGNIMVSIHAIATFKALDDYLRPRIAIQERAQTRTHARRNMPAGAAAAFAEAIAGGVFDNGASPLGNRLASSSHAAPAQSPEATSGRKTPDSKAEAVSSSAFRAASGSRPRSQRSAQVKTEMSTPPPAPPPPAGEDGAPQSALECADEAHVSDDEDDGDHETFEDIVGEFEEELEEDTEDPGAVNMEVAATGRVTARQEDGTKVDTPTSTQGPTPAPNMPRNLPHEMARSLLSGNFGRSLSYAAALQATPQDWHLEFSVNGRSISNETTIYRAVHFNRPGTEDLSARNIWSQVHSIDYKRVDGPPLAESTSLNPHQEQPSSRLPQSLEQNSVCAQILRLLRILHEMNDSAQDLVSDALPGANVSVEPQSQFVNTKLTAKLNRQLEEPLIVASNCLPSWSEDLARLYPFLFPFETRHLFLQSTSFGYSRSMSRWQSGQSNATGRHRSRDERPFLGRLQRQKVRISRHKLIESAVKVMEMYGASPSMLEVEFFDEVGTGLGPTLEFYSNVSKEFSKKKLRLWRENESERHDEYAFGKHGLFPAPLSKAQLSTDNGQKILTLFTMLGKFVARSMLDSRIIDISFNPTFFRACAGPHAIPLTLGSVRSVDQGLASSLQTIKQFVVARAKIDEQTRLTPTQKAQKLSLVQVGGANINDLGLDFTLPGYATVELIPGGSQIAVTLDNVGLYLEKVIEYTLLTSIQHQVEAFKKGFSQVFPYEAMAAFTPEELVMLFGRSDEDWSVENHGYNIDSKSVRHLLQTMSEFTGTQRRDFLQFITGSPKLPIGGFKALTPMFTVVCKPSEAPYVPDDYLPSVMTCVNYLKLPDYSSLDVMRERLAVAIREGQGAFHLS